MLTPEVKDWVSVLAPTASAFAAITALGVFLWVANAQRRNQAMQLKQNLFDKRYNVYLVVEEFLMHVLRTNGSFNMPGEEFRRFKYAAEQAEFLFGADVVSYMKEINKVAVDLWPKCSKRDHLANMGENIAALGAEITPMLGYFGDVALKTRDKVFGPYLQLSPSPAAEGSAVPIKLNGWQRLWVVAAVVWLPPILACSYLLWPTGAEVSNADIYKRMKADDAKRLLDYYDVVAAQSGGAPAPLTEGHGQYTAADIDWSKTTDNGSGQPLNRQGAAAPSKAIDFSDLGGKLVSPPPSNSTPLFDMSKAKPINQGQPFDPNQPYQSASAPSTPVVEIDGHTLQFINGVSRKEMNETAASYHTALVRVLTGRRAAFVGEAFALWIVPAVALYALGFAVGWVRRGFGAGKLTA
jgi:hypothetical protein